MEYILNVTKIAVSYYLLGYRRVLAVEVHAYGSLFRGSVTQGAYSQYSGLMEDREFRKFALIQTDHNKDFIKITV